MVTSVVDFNSEAGFLQTSFVEFVKCWSMGTNSTFHVESRNGQAYLNFSAYLGSPRNVHFYEPKQKLRSKSERKTKRDNERAAMFQANQSRISSSSTPLMKNSNISDTTDQCDENTASDTTSDTTSDNIPDDVSESDTIVPDKDDDNPIETRSEIQSNEPSGPASINNQPLVNTERNVTNSTERSNVANQIAIHDRHPGFIAPAVALSEYEVIRIVQIAVANGKKIGPQQVSTFVRLYNM